MSFAQFVECCYSSSYISSTKQRTFLLAAVSTQHCYLVSETASEALSHWSSVFVNCNLVFELNGWHPMCVVFAVVSV